MHEFFNAITHDEVMDLSLYACAGILISTLVFVCYNVDTELTIMTWILITSVYVSCLLAGSKVIVHMLNGTHTVMLSIFVLVWVLLWPVVILTIFLRFEKNKGVR